MSGRLAVLCPGQGGQHDGMFDMARADPRAAGFIARAAPASSADMFENRVAQPAIVAATLAMWEALRNRVPAPVLAAGYSIGELAAYGVAGAMPPDDVVALAGKRAKLMDQAAQEHPGQLMVAITGLPVQHAREVAQQARFDVAIVTGEDSCIVGGLADGLELLDKAVQSRGGRFQPLPVAIASHTRLMAAAVAPFAQVLQASAFASPLCPVLSGIAATRISSKDQAVEHLSRQLAQTILWSACMDAVVECGATVVLELGPGCALARMFRARHPDLPCRSVAEFRSLEGIVTWLERQLD